MIGKDGFVGHIGGDDFIFILPIDSIGTVCTEILDVFDTLIPYQYNEQDRRAGYYFGKDRGGQLHRVPFVTLSICVRADQPPRFPHTDHGGGAAPPAPRVPPGAPAPPPARAPRPAMAPPPSPIARPASPSAPPAPPPPIARPAIAAPARPASPAAASAPAAARPIPAPRAP